MYYANVNVNVLHKILYGITETKWKQQYANYIKFFRHKKQQRDTELSNEL